MCTMTKPLKFFDRFVGTLDFLLYLIYVAGAAASALAVLVAVVLVVISGYTDRPDLAESAGYLFGKAVIGFFVFLILGRQTRKQRTRSRDLDAKGEEMEKRIEAAKRRVSAQGSGAGKSG